MCLRGATPWRSTACCTAFCRCRDGAGSADLAGHLVHEVAEEEVDLDRVAGVGQVSAALEEHEVSSGELCHAPASLGALAHVARPADDQHRAAHPSADLLGLGG